MISRVVMRLLGVAHLRHLLLLCVHRGLSKLAAMSLLFKLELHLPLHELLLKELGALSHVIHPLIARMTLRQIGVVMARRLKIKLLLLLLLIIVDTFVLGISLPLLLDLDFDNFSLVFG